jgi:hypothetical protein
MSKTVKRIFIIVAIAVTIAVGVIIGLIVRDYNINHMIIDGGPADPPVMSAV